MANEFDPQWTNINCSLFNLHGTSNHTPANIPNMEGLVCKTTNCQPEAMLSWKDNSKMERLQTSQWNLKNLILGLLCYFKFPLRDPTILSIKGWPPKSVHVIYLHNDAPSSGIAPVTAVFKTQNNELLMLHFCTDKGLHSPSLHLLQNFISTRMPSILLT